MLLASMSIGNYVERDTSLTADWSGQSHKEKLANMNMMSVTMKQNDELV